VKKIIFAALIGCLAFSSVVFSQTRWIRLHPDVSRQYLERWEKEHQWLTPARGGRIYFQKHEVGRARELLEKAVAEGAEDGRLLYELGYSCRVQGDNEAAQKNLEKAAELLARDDPGHLYNFNARYLSGLILEERGEEEQALARYSSALELRPEVSALRYRRAYLLSRKGDATAGRVEIERVLEREPDSGSALFLAGLLSLENGEYAAGEGYLERALAAGVEPAPVHYGLGYIALRRDNIGEAFRRYESALAADPGHRDALISLANLSYREDDLDRARKYFELLVEREPERPRWHYNLGVVYRDLGLDELSRVALDEARRLDPEMVSSTRLTAEASGPFARAEEMLEKGKFREAILLYRQSLAEDPFFIPAHFNLAVAYRKAGQGRRAFRQYGRLLRVDSDHAAAHLNAGIIAVDFRDRPAAALHLRRYLLLEPDSPQGELAQRYLREMRGW
jgi:tetratricopeptide (TPR) repeat protein